MGFNVQFTICNVGDGFPVPAVKGYEFAEPLGKYAAWCCRDGEPVPYITSWKQHDKLEFEKPAAVRRQVIGQFRAWISLISTGSKAAPYQWFSTSAVALMHSTV